MKNGELHGDLLVSNEVGWESFMVVDGSPGSRAFCYMYMHYVLC